MNVAITATPGIAPRRSCWYTPLPPRRRQTMTSPMATSKRHEGQQELLHVGPPRSQHEVQAAEQDGKESAAGSRGRHGRRQQRLPLADRLAQGGEQKAQDRGTDGDRHQQGFRPARRAK
jgi:hypothetical protein